MLLCVFVFFLLLLLFLLSQQFRDLAAALLGLAEATEGFVLAPILAHGVKKDNKLGPNPCSAKCYQCSMAGSSKNLSSEG